jgi:MFS family permease
VWTRDTHQAFRAGRAIQAGRVWTNCYHLYPAHAAFGGYKQSGIGRENHKMMLDHYQQTKNLLVSYDPEAHGLLLFLLADRYPRAWFVRAGLTVMALAAVGAALAPGPIGLAIALSVSWVATGAGVALAQATLLDAQPTQRARTMARWTLASLAGDLAAPAVLIGCTHADVAIRGDAWRGTYAVVAGALVLGAIATMLVRFPRATGSGDDDDAPTPGLWATLRGALGDRHLMAWLLGVALCDLLDELLVVLATLHVRDNLGGGAAAQSASSTACSRAATSARCWSRALRRAP